MALAWADWTDEPLESGDTDLGVYIREIQSNVNFVQDRANLGLSQWINASAGEKFRKNHYAEPMKALKAHALLSYYGYGSIEDVLGRPWSALPRRANDNTDLAGYMLLNDMRFVLDALAAVTHAFLVTGPATITRGVAFDLDIQSYFIATGELDESYIPVSIINLGITSTDPGDTSAPLTTDNTGWSNGKKTVSVTIDGGSESDLITFRVNDPFSRREGFLSVPLAPDTETELSAGTKQMYLGRATEVDSGINEWDPAAEVLFRTVQIDGQTLFEADTTFQTGGGELRSLVDGSTTVNFLSQATGGYIAFAVSDPQKIGLLAVRLKVNLFSRLQQFLFSPPGTATTEFSRYAWMRRLVLSPSEAANTYLSGLAMTSMSPIEQIEMTWVNQQQATSGGTPTSPTNIYIDIPKGWVANLDGNTLYLWFYMDQSGFIPYTLFKSEVTQGKSAAQRTLWTQADTKLVLYT